MKSNAIVFAAGDRTLAIGGGQTSRVESVKIARMKARFPLAGSAAHSLTMHPADAAGRGIGEGQRVRVFNARGEGLVVVRLSEEVMPGVVSLPEGIWVRLDKEGKDREGSANMFTATQGTAPAVATIMHGVHVEVCATGA